MTSAYNGFAKATQAAAAIAWSGWLLSSNPNHWKVVFTPLSLFSSWHHGIAFIIAYHIYTGYIITYPFWQASQQTFSCKSVAKTQMGKNFCCSKNLFENLKEVGWGEKRPWLPQSCYLIIHEVKFYDNVHSYLFYLSIQLSTWV